MKDIVLENICWSFIGATYTSSDEFRVELLKYQLEGFEEDLLDEICILERMIEIEYWTYEKDNQVDRKVIIEADNGISLSVVELLYKLHNLVVEDMEEIDHHFFQGLIPLKSSRKSGVRGYEIWQGS